jgi:hypothetical protein
VKSSTAKEAKGRICRHQASLNTSAIKNHPTVIGSRLGDPDRRDGRGRWPWLYKRMLEDKASRPAKASDPASKPRAVMAPVRPGITPDKATNTGRP